MIRPELSLKRVALSKSNTQVVAVTAVAAFITVFCLVTANYLLGIRSYQAKILNADNVADSQLKRDVIAKNDLVSSYHAFVQKNPTLLGSNISTTNNLDYNNATIILDALPSQYDFPALTTSIQKMLQNGGFTVSSIGGTDESATISNTPSGNPSPVSIPFTFTINNASYSSVQQLFKTMQQSIRPMQIDTINLSGSDSSMQVSVTAHTYFQPGKKFKIGTETIAQ